MWLMIGDIGLSLLFGWARIWVTITVFGPRYLFFIVFRPLRKMEMTNEL